MQSSVDITSLASPFDDFFQKYIPREHEKALRNCFIQALAFIFVCCILFGLYYVYSILEPFCVPLFWALLTGTVCHPYKRRMTNSLRQSLEALRKSEQTMGVAVGVALFSKVDGGAVLVATSILEKWKVIAVGGLLLPFLYLVYCWSPATASQALDLIQEIFLDDFSLFLNTVSFHHIAVSAIISLVSIVFGRVEYRLFYQLTSLVTWILLGSYLMNFLWPPLVYLMAGLLVYGACCQSHGVDTPDGGESRLKSVVISALQTVGVLNRTAEETDILLSPPKEECDERRASSPVVQVSLIMSPPTPPARSASVEAPRLPIPATSEDGNLRVQMPEKRARSTGRAVGGLGTVLAGPLESTPKVTVMQHPGVSAIQKLHGVGNREKPNISSIEGRGSGLGSMGGSTPRGGLGGNTPRTRAMGR